MKKVNHPNCIAFQDMFDSKDKLYIVMEYMTGGELFDRIIDEGHFSEMAAAKCFRQIVKAVAYLHSIGIVHRDIKPENILYADKSPDSLVKLADFGLGKIIDIHSTQKVMRTVCGTPSYLAPEIIQRQGYGKECDIWSSGVILYILLSGCPPFDQGKPPNALFQDILNARYNFPEDYWGGVAREAQDLVRKMMLVNPKARLNPEQILAHPWMLRYKAGELSVDCLGVQDRLRDWQATRRLKSAINTFVALLRMSSAMLSDFPDEKTQQQILEKVRGDPARLQVPVRMSECFEMEQDETGISSHGWGLSV
jgi:serine/threonine protein kinase